MEDAVDRDHAGVLVELVAAAPDQLGQAYGSVGTRRAGVRFNRYAGPPSR